MMATGTAAVRIINSAVFVVHIVVGVSIGAMNAFGTLLYPTGVYVNHFSD